jgi:hypothetical protein
MGHVRHTYFFQRINDLVQKHRSQGLDKISGVAFHLPVFLKRRRGACTRIEVVEPAVSVCGE